MPSGPGTYRKPGRPSNARKAAAAAVKTTKPKPTRKPK
jgi:hypothetical protein